MELLEAPKDSLAEPEELRSNQKAHTLQDGEHLLRPSKSPLQRSHMMQECSERRVFNAVSGWAFGFAEPDSEVLCQSIADVEGLLLLIRFPLMAPEELQVSFRTKASE